MLTKMLAEILSSYQPLEGDMAHNLSNALPCSLIFLEPLNQAKAGLCGVRIARSGDCQSLWDARGEGKQ